MTTKDTDEFDPRFDPAFQRGFEGTESRFRPRVREQRPAEQAAATPAAIAGSEPRSVPLATPVGAPVAPLEPGHPSVGRPSGDADDSADAASRTGMNPFVLALAVVSVALIAGGVWGVQAARAPFLETDAAANVDYSGLQMLMTFAPMAIALGIATAVGILFLFAVRWRRGQ